MKIRFLQRPSGTGRPEGKQPWWMSAYVLIPLVAVVDTLIVECFNHKVFTDGFSSMAGFLSDYTLAFFVNVCLVLITLAPAFFLRRRVFWCALVSSIWLIAGGVNGFILMSRMTPFTTADLTVLNTGLETLPNYMSTENMILLGIALIALPVLLIILLLRGPKNNESQRRRLITGGVSLAVSAVLLAGSWTMAFHLGKLSNVFANLAFAYEDYGFSYCFLQTWLNKGISEPEGYGASEIQRISEEIEENTVETEAQTDVNVVFVQLESFMDPYEIKGLELNEDPIPTWHALQEEYTTGYLHVPVVGAGTANTEFEVLTGMSSRLFGPGEYPYKTCLQDQTVESVAYDLKSLGYAAHAIHNHRATFYTRNIVYANLGFDDFTSLEYMPKVVKTPQGWSKDYVLTSQISNALDVTENQADLVFTVSVQGHGGYPKKSVLEDPEITVTACPENCNTYSMEYYVNEMHEMDEFLSNLIKALSMREEKTILVLYGDHLPSMNLTAGDMESGSLYKTQYVIWDNFGLEKEDTNLYAYQLAAEALSKIGISEGFMTKFHQFCQQEPTYRNDLADLQYDVLYGSRYLYDGQTPYEPSDMKMGMAEIQVTDLYERDGAWYVRGENFSPYCKITVDGKILDTSYVNTTMLQINEDPKVDSYRDLYISVVDTHKEVLSDTE